MFPLNIAIVAIITCMPGQACLDYFSVISGWFFLSRLGGHPSSASGALVSSDLE